MTMKLPFLKIVLAIVAFLGLAACVTVGPDYTPPTDTLPAGWIGADTDAQPATTGTSVGDISQWWKSMNDPLLSELIAQALASSPDLRSAQARLRAARANRAVASGEQFPSVTANASAMSRHSSKTAGNGQTSELFSAGFDASWELDIFGGIRRSVEAADADFQLSEATLQDTQVSLAAEVASIYTEVRSLQARLLIARDALSSQSETLQLTEWRAQAGLVNGQDVEQARSNREQTRAQIPLLQIGLSEAEHRLEILMGLVPGALQSRLAEGNGLPTIPGEIAVGIPADIVRQRPDIRKAERLLAAETARVGVAEAARYPSLKLNGSIGIEALTVGTLGDSGAVTSSVLAGITAPIFDAGRLRNKVEIQDAVREQALVAYEKSLLSALQEVENALVAIARNRERVNALESAAQSARNARQLAQQRYQAGLIDFQSVLDTERILFSVEDTLASSRADGVLALIRLYKALGGGWSPQIATSPAGKETQ
jgi:NodT family efflux transporter outer membrane factor (OMF) lipoprotein